MTYNQKDSIFATPQRDPGGWISVPNRKGVRSEPFQRRRTKEFSQQCSGNTDRVSIVTPEKWYV